MFLGTMGCSLAEQLHKKLEVTHLLALRGLCHLLTRDSPKTVMAEPPRGRSNEGTALGSTVLGGLQWGQCPLAAQTPKKTPKKRALQLK